MMDLQISASTMTGKVTVDIHGTIKDTPMVWQMFRGQPVTNLLNWLKTLGDGDVRVFWLDDEAVIPVKSRSQLRRFIHHADKA